MFFADTGFHHAKRNDRRPSPARSTGDNGSVPICAPSIYFAVLTGCLGFALATTSPLRLMLALALLVYFDLKARREERWLLEQYPGYAPYKRRVKKLIPGID